LAKAATPKRERERGKESERDFNRGVPNARARNRSLLSMMGDERWKMRDERWKMRDGSGKMGGEIAEG